MDDLAIAQLGGEYERSGVHPELYTQAELYRPSLMIHICRTA